jgi:hypothetical protein
VLDQFAALRTYTSDAPSVGGFRVLSGRRNPLGKRITSAATVAALARARMRLTGFLSVLFVGGLGLAVLAGPANCPCTNAFSAVGESSLARLGYVQNTDLLTTRESEPELPSLSTATLIEPETKAPDLKPLTEAKAAEVTAAAALPPAEQTAAEAPPQEAPAADVSSITTSALEPAQAPLVAHEAPTASETAAVAPNVHEVGEAAPVSVKLAAAPSLESDVPPTLPAVEVSTPPRMEITAIEADEAAPRAKRTAKASVAKRSKRVTRAYRSPTTVAKKKANPTDPTPPPKWAAQMFTNPWQSQAFSYTR